MTDTSLMDKWRQKKAEKRAARDAEAAARQPCCDDHGLPVVKFWTPMLGFPRDSSPYPAYISAIDSKTNQNFDVGTIFLNWNGTQLFLDKIEVYDFFKKRRFGQAALQFLTNTARAAGFTSIEGEISEDYGCGSFLPDFYKTAGYTVNGLVIRLDL